MNQPDQQLEIVNNKINLEDFRMLFELMFRSQKLFC